VKELYFLIDPESYGIVDRLLIPLSFSVDCEFNVIRF